MKKKKNYKTILESIGNTKLVKLDLKIKPTLFAKFEFLSVGGSIKDRSALFMIKDAEKKGFLKTGGTIVEASSGNQGSALAMIGAIKGYKVIITVPDVTSSEKISVLRAYGAQVYVCPSSSSHDDPKGYVSKAKKLVKTIPGAFMPNQYFNPSNVEAHYTTTGPEIWKQTNGTITHFITGVGSCGTISGAGRYLKEQNSNIKIIGVDAKTSFYSSKNPKPYKTEGIGINVISETFNQSIVDQIIPVSDEDAFTMTRKLAKDFGLLVGLSSGAVMHATLKYAKKLNKNDVIVVILADSGRSYLSKILTPESNKKEG